MSRADDLERESETWRPVPIPAFSEFYEVSSIGRVRLRVKRWPYAAGRLLAPCRHPRVRGSVSDKIRFVDKDGKRKEYTLHRVVYSAFKNHGVMLPSNYSIMHINGDIYDHHINNLRAMTKAELGTLKGGDSRRRPVAKIDRNGNMLAFYPSARKAAAANFLSYQSVMDRCNNQVKKPFRLTGFSFCWDDDER